MRAKKVGVVIVTYNGLHLLRECLASLRGQSVRDALSVVVVDNGSSDGTVEFVHSAYPEVHCIQLPNNSGFAYPNNLGIEHLFLDNAVAYVLTLNNDVELDPHFVEELVREAERDESVGVIQGKLYRKNQSKMIDCVGMLVYPDMSAMNRGQHQLDTGQFDSPEDIFGASASAALYSRRALEATRVGQHDYFDSSYFAYYEDVQLAWKIRLAGYRGRYTPSAVAFHSHSATGVSYSPFKAFHIHRNHYYNIITLLPTSLLLLALALIPIRYVLLVSSVFRKRGAAARLSKNTTNESMHRIVFRSWKDVFVNLRHLLDTRRQIAKQRVVSIKDILRWYKQYKADIRTMIYGQEA